jgi:DNA polymerase III epsilon subunit-like protein
VEKSPIARRNGARRGFRCASAREIPLEDRPRALDENDDHDDDPDEDADDESAHGGNLPDIRSAPRARIRPADCIFVTSDSGRSLTIGRVKESSAMPETLVSVDVEASGQSPSIGSLLSIGACLVDDPNTAIYLELKPLPDRRWDVEAERVHGLSQEHLAAEGLEPREAMAAFADWVSSAANGSRPIFVGFNAPFDWMFVADYFWRYLGRNPFGVSALDLKSYYMAHQALDRWDETRRVHVDERLGLEPDHNHQALDDARGQAALARILLQRSGEARAG